MLALDAMLNHARHGYTSIATRNVRTPTLAEYKLAETLDGYVASVDARTQTSAAREARKPASPRPEIEILQMGAEGETNKEITNHLQISAATTERQVANVSANVGAGVQNSPPPALCTLIRRTLNQYVPTQKRSIAWGELLWPMKSTSSRSSIVRRVL
jgi:DNA-binding CsgD family transcriptional regulator